MVARPTEDHLRRWASSDDHMLAAAANEALTYRQALIDVCKQWASQFGPRTRAVVEAAFDLSADDSARVARSPQVEPCRCGYADDVCPHRRPDGTRICEPSPVASTQEADRD